MHLPMCSDFYPHGAVAQAYGVFREGQMLAGISNRAVFIVDRSGEIVFSKVYPLDQTPDNEELFAALNKIH
jgi:peroxiredoxin